MSEATTNTAPTSEALREIRDGRLYRAAFGTFEDYCRERWGLTPRYGLMLVRAAEVVSAIGTTVPILPSTERQARELTRLEEPDQQLAAWQAVVKAWAAARDAKLAELAAAHVDREIGTLPLPVGEFLDPAAAA